MPNSFWFNLNYLKKNNLRLTVWIMIRHRTCNILKLLGVLLWVSKTFIPLSVLLMGFQDIHTSQCHFYGFPRHSYLSVSFLWVSKTFIPLSVIFMGVKDIHTSQCPSYGFPRHSYLSVSFLWVSKTFIPNYQTIDIWNKYGRAELRLLHSYT